MTLKLLSNKIAGQYTTRPGTRGKDWCVLVYACGANEMEPEIMNSLLDMEKACLTDRIVVVVQVARASREMVKALRPGAPRYNIDGPWHGVRRYVIRPRPSAAAGGRIYSPPLDFGENPNTASPGSLYDFLRWGMTGFPARRYMVILSGHGAGFFGALTDYSHGRPYIMGIPGLARALSLAGRQAGKKIDLLALDTCYMNMVEVLYELSLTRAAGQLLVPVSAAPVEGFPYSVMLNTLCSLAGEKEVRKVSAGIAKAINQHWQNGFRVCPADLWPGYFKSIKRAAGLMAASEQIINLNHTDRGFLIRRLLWPAGLIEKTAGRYFNRALKAPEIMPGPGSPCLTIYNPGQVEEYNYFSRYYESLLFTRNNRWLNKISQRPRPKPGSHQLTRLKNRLYCCHKEYLQGKNKHPPALPGPQPIPRGLLINSLVDLNPGYNSKYFEQVTIDMGWHKQHV